MFEKALADRLQKIFDFDKVTFDVPGESQEQEGMFVEIESARCRIKDARQIARATGTLHAFAQADKLPYGYFTKAIAKAKPEWTKDLFFFDFEENKGTIRNIAQRSIGFLFLFDSQFDPAIGTSNQVNITIAESP